MVGDLNYLEDCHMKGLDLSSETQRAITRIGN